MGFSDDTINERFGKHNKEIEKMSRSWQLVGNTVVDVGYVITDSISAAIWDTKQKLIDLGRIGKTILSGLLSSLVRLGIGTLGNMIGGPVGGFIATSFAVEPKALGGSVMGNTPYLVGEKGPELFTPNTAGSITPNNQLGVGTTIEKVEIIVPANGNIFTDRLALRRVTETIADELTKVQSTYLESA